MHMHRAHASYALFYFFPEEWQLPRIAQLLHPQPQEDLPFFLSRTIFTMTSATIATSTIDITIVPRLSENQPISRIPFSQSFHVNIIVSTL